jgi:hypothetical protein
MSKKSPYPSSLTTPVSEPYMDDLTVEILDLPSDERELYDAHQAFLHQARFIDLIKFYKIDIRGPHVWEQLAIALMSDHVEGMQLVNKSPRGRRRDWSPKMNEILHYIIKSLEREGYQQQYAIESIWKHRSSLDYIPDTVASKDAIASQFKKIDRLIKKAKAAYRPFTTEEAQLLRKGEQLLRGE